MELPHAAGGFACCMYLTHGRVKPSPQLRRTPARLHGFDADSTLCANPYRQPTGLVDQTCSRIALSTRSDWLAAHVPAKRVERYLRCNRPAL
jgi:hypothetical protein